MRSSALWFDVCKGWLVVLQTKWPSAKNSIINIVKDVIPIRALYKKGVIGC